jgi:hypothetical protein
MLDFLQGILFALVPSILVVAWLIWRATPFDRERDQLDQH